MWVHCYFYGTTTNNDTISALSDGFGRPSTRQNFEKSDAMRRQLCLEVWRP